jgi:hypothetical protein
MGESAWLGIAVDDDIPRSTEPRLGHIAWLVFSDIKVQVSNEKLLHGEVPLISLSVR